MAGIAQSFYVFLPRNIPGMFVTKLDLYFQQKDSDLGVKIDLREMEAGDPTEKVLPNSTVLLDPDAINVSEDGTTATTITFPNPIYLMNSREYCFAVTMHGDNPNTRLWVATQGYARVDTGEKIQKQPHVGIMYITSNDRGWSKIQDSDVKFNLHRARFKYFDGNVTLTNEDKDIFKLSNISAAFDQYGEEIKGETNLTLSVSNGTISIGNWIHGLTSGANGYVTANSATYKLSNTQLDFTAGEPFVVYSGASKTGVVGTITTQSYAEGVLEEYEAKSSNNVWLFVANSTGTFTAGEQVIGRTSGAYANIASIMNFDVHVLNTNIDHILPETTGISFQIKPTSNTGVAGSFGANKIVEGEDYEFSATQSIHSTSNTADTMKTKAFLTTDNNWVSPAIDLERSHFIAVHNIINNDSTNEDSNAGGNALNRYITDTVALKDGQDAEDILLYLSEWRPSGTSVKVYAKFLNGEDSADIDDLNWIELSRASKSTVYSDLQDKDDYLEAEFGIPASYLTGTNEAFQYTRDSVTYTSYKYVKIKIILLSVDKAIVPKVKDMRAICLQK